MSIPKTARKRTPSPTWHELVQPGPKGDPAKKQARAESRHRGQIVKQAGDGFNRATRREAGARGWNPGRLVQHPGRLRSRSGGGIDRTVSTPAAVANQQARIARKAARAAA